MKTATVLKPVPPSADGSAAVEAALCDALLAGQPTAPHRARLAELHSAVARAAAEQTDADAGAEAAEGAAIVALADSIVAQAGARLAARSAEPIPNTNRPEKPMLDHPLLAAPAQNVATATKRATAADNALISAAEAEMLVVSGLDDLRARHAAIVARRARGETSVDDGGDLALLAADVEGLAPLLAEAQAGTAAARRAVEHARGQAALARSALASVEAAIEHDARVVHAGALDAVLAGALGRLGELRAALGRGGTLPCAPSPELSLVRKLLAQTGRL